MTDHFNHLYLPDQRTSIKTLNTFIYYQLEIYYHRSLHIQFLSGLKFAIIQLLALTFDRVIGP